MGIRVLASCPSLVAELPLSPIRRPFSLNFSLFALSPATEEPVATLNRDVDHGVSPSVGSVFEVSPTCDIISYCIYTTITFRTNNLHALYVAYKLLILMYKAENNNPNSNKWDLLIYLMVKHKAICHSN